MDDLGGGEAAAGLFGELARAGNELQQVFFRERDRTRRIMFDDFDGRLVGEDSRIRLELQKLRGKNALGATDRLLPEFEKFEGELEKETDDEAVLSALRRSYGHRRAQLKDFGQRHEAGEREEYAKNAFTVHLGNLEQMAALTAAGGDPQGIFIHDPGWFEETLKEGARVIQDRLSDLGQDREAVDAAISDWQSARRYDALKAMTARGDDLDAKARYGEWKPLMLPKHRDAVEVLLQEGSTRGESLRVADEILSGPDGDSLTNARKHLKDIKNAAVRDMTDQRLIHEFSIRDAEKARRQDEMYEKYADLLDKNPDKMARDLVTPEDWKVMDDRTRGALDRKSQRKNQDKDTDPVAMLDFIELTSDRQRLGMMSRANVERDFLSKMSKTDGERAAREWAAAKEALAKPEKPYKPGYFNDTAYLLDGLRRAGLGGIKAGDTLESIRNEPKKANAFWQFTLDAERAILDAGVKEGDEMGARRAVGAMLARKTKVELEVPGWNVEKTIEELTGEDIKKIAGGFEKINLSYVDNMIRVAKDDLGVTLDRANPEHQMRITRAWAYWSRLQDETDDATVAAILRGEW